MNKAIRLFVTLLLACVAICLVVSSRIRDQQRAAELESERANWRNEKEALQTALDAARQRSPAKPAAHPPDIVRITNAASVTEILERLKTLRTSTNSPRTARLIIHQFEALAELGPAALPAIREFLTQNVDVEYQSAPGRQSFRDGRIPTEFTFPPSLRLGLLEIAKRIGTEGGEQILAEILSGTRKGAEVAYTAYALQELAPNKYRNVAFEAARNLLAKASPLNTSGGFEKFDRDYLYGVLNFYGDTSYVATAQAQIIQPNGSVDAVAMRYLQQTLGPQAIALAAQAWQDQRVAADQKEPLARVALTYAGLDPQADQFYQTAINDPNLPPKHRKNLIEDLNEAGFADPKNLTTSDLPLIQKRLAMVEQLALNAMDQVNADAFKEAYKDLLKMQHSVEKAGAK